MFLDTPITRKCELCKREFVITKKWSINKRFCNTSCSAKWRMAQPEIKAKVHNKEIDAKRGASRARYLKTDKAKPEIERIRQLTPSLRKDVQVKISKRLKEIGHKPSIRGGNGKGMTEPQRLLFELLDEAATPELAISLGKRQDGYPTNYKVDIGIPDKMIAIEVDGESHRSRRQLDIKKDKKLNSLGWTVLRFWNKDILEWFNDNNRQSHNIATVLSNYNIKINP